MTNAVSTRESYNVFYYSSDKEMWDILKKIYVVPNDMERENLFIQEWFSNIGINLIKYASNKYLRFKNWYQKSDPALDSKDT